MSFERYTNTARNVIRLAHQHSVKFDTAYTETSDILLGLIEEGNSVASHVLRNLGLTLAGIIHDIEEQWKYTYVISRKSDYKAPFTAMACEAFTAAEAAALKLGHSYVGTEHLLLGLVKSSEANSAMIVLRKYGLSAEIAADEVMDVLGKVKQTCEGEAAKVKMLEPVSNAHIRLVDLLYNLVYKTGVLPIDKLVAQIHAVPDSSISHCLPETKEYLSKLASRILGTRDLCTAWTVTTRNPSHNNK